jgi:cytochrome P450
MHIIIPKGTILAIPVNVIQTDPEFWGPDADVFRPQRWIERKKAGTQRGRELLTFSEGCVHLTIPINPDHKLPFDSPRSCIGRAFALAEIKASTLYVRAENALLTIPY